MTRTHYCRNGSNVPACRANHLDDGYAGDETVFDVNCSDCMKTDAYQAARWREMQRTTTQEKGNLEESQRIAEKVASIKAGGSTDSCFNCGGGAEGDDYEFNCNDAVQEMHCLDPDCDTQWQLVYQFAGIELLS